MAKADGRKWKKLEMGEGIMREMSREETGEKNRKKLEENNFLSQPRVSGEKKQKRERERGKGSLYPYCTQNVEKMLVIQRDKVI